MRSKLIPCVVALLLATVPVAAAPQVQDDHVYDHPRKLDFLRNVIPDNRDFFLQIFRREAAFPVVTVLGSTALLIWKDQELVDAAHRLGTRWRISHDPDQTGRYGFHVGPTRLEFGFPKNLGQGMYFLGDGWLQLGTAGGFVAYGLTQDDNRALQTASQMAESVLASGVIVQTLKHVTGRESPFRSEKKGGTWRFFPNQIDYHKNVAKYDAFPSGHLAAGMASITVISSNYPEYPAICPIGYTLMGILSFQMMNNGVHWAGDYPLALALGYGFGKIAVNRGRKKAGRQASELTIRPLTAGSVRGFNLEYRF